MDCPHRIHPLGTPTKHHQPKLHRSHHARSGTRYHHEDRDRRSHSRSQSHFTDTAAQVIMIHIETVPGHDIGIIITTPRVAHDAQVPHARVIAINPAATHHIDPTRSHPHREVHHHMTPETEVGHVHIHPTNPQDEIHTCPLQHIKKQATSQEEHQSKNRRSTHGLLQF